MFIAVELSHAPATEHNCQLCEKPVCVALDKINQSEAGRKVFHTVFPDGDGGFMTTIPSILEEEANRREDDRLRGVEPENPDLQHESWHDLESIFWMALYGLTRANPLGLGTDNYNSWKYNDFCEAMFGHYVAQGQSDGPRALYLFGDIINMVFHPRLRCCEYSMSIMARYLSVPWHLYRGRVDELHAFTACRRLQLDRIVNAGSQVLDLHLDTAAPRAADPFPERPACDPSCYSLVRLLRAITQLAYRNVARRGTLKIARLQIGLRRRPSLPSRRVPHQRSSLHSGKAAR